MRQLILFLAKYRSTLLLIVFVLIALLRHSLKNPVAEHRLNSIGFGAVASVQNAYPAGNNIGDLMLSMRNWPVRMQRYVQEAKVLLQDFFQILMRMILFLRGSLNTLTTNGTITSLFMRVVKTEYSQEWAR